MNSNRLDTEAAKHLSDALTTNSTLQKLEYVAAHPFPTVSTP